MQNILPNIFVVEISLGRTKALSHYQVNANSELLKQLERWVASVANKSRKGDSRKLQGELTMSPLNSSPKNQ